MAAPRKPKKDQLRESITKQTPDKYTADTQPTHSRSTKDPGETPARNVRISNRDWDALKSAAAEEGTSAGAIIRRLIREYLRGTR